ncbi:MAG TPA: alpha/beta hydrolase [Polyangiaceae bacterium]|nr:alpha/beta hydrolase [Polyangiaceae bacterium]
MIRQGKGPPLVLFHGVLGSEAMWRHVVPLLSATHETFAPTALGHRGGRPAAERPARIADVIDDAQRTLDELGLDAPHLAGNSMGGWVALELARRGRARSVCALSPAGFWGSATSGPSRATSVLRATIHDTKRGRPILPLLARVPRFRRWAMRLNAVHGERVAAQELVSLADDLLGCVVAFDLLSTTEFLAPFDPLPCPTTIAWSAKDKVLPRDLHEPRARETVPQARFLVLDGVGHVPMFDAPDVVARVILESTGAAATNGKPSPIGATASP